MAEFEYAIGTLDGIEEKASGWSKIKVDVGTKYPLVLDTKKEEIIEQARAARGEVATWKYKETESDNINERSGKPYMNRYLEAVKVGHHLPEGYTPTAGSKSNGAKAGGGRSYTEEDIKRFEDKERRDYMSRAWAHTMTAMQHTFRADEDPDELFKRLQAFQRKIYTDICGRFSWPEDDRDLPSGSDGEENATALSQHDDDIPF